MIGMRTFFFQVYPEKQKKETGKSLVSIVKSESALELRKKK